MTATLTTTQPRPTRQTSARLYRQVHAKGRTLRLTRAALEACATVGDVQRLAKPAYRTLARRYHPDTQAGLLATGQAPMRLARGATFQRLTAAYRWLMALDAALVLTPPPPERYELALTPMPDVVLPWALERAPLLLGAGWHETPKYW